MARSLARAIFTSHGRYALGAEHPWAQRLWRRMSFPLSLLRRHRENRLRNAYVSRYGLTVRRGPFAGLVYPEARARDGYRLVPALLGAFESELHPVLADALDRGYGAAVNIGSSGGYYAAGLARAKPGATVHAFEASPRLRNRTAELARANGVAECVRIHGYCDTAALRALELSEPFVVCDCEGCEVEVLDPEAVPFLRSATLLVELHDHVRPGSTDELLQRFAGSHDVTLIESCPRDPADYEELRSLRRRDAARALDEGRPGPMRWAYLTPQRTRSTG